MRVARDCHSIGCLLQSAEALRHARILVHTAITRADSPFGDKYVISLGYLITMAVTIPLGFVNLDDNMIVQVRRACVRAVDGAASLALADYCVVAVASVSLPHASAGHTQQ